MNVEQLRAFCLSLGLDVEEKMPFQAFKAAIGVLVFYVCGHMFCYFDLDHFNLVTVKCKPEHINALKEQNDFITDPYNMSPRHWIGIEVDRAPDRLIQHLVADSYAIVKQQYTPKRNHHT